MEKITLVKKVKSQIGDNQIYQAISFLVENLEDEGEKNTAILFSSRWQELSIQVQNGTINNSIFWETRNKIVSDLMNFCERIAAINVKSNIQERQDELISILIFRAEKINHELKKYSMMPKITEYLNRFNHLHEQHISELKKGNFISAHEILGRIHDLSTWVEVEKKGDRNEVMKLLQEGGSYFVDPLSEYKNGIITKVYLNTFLFHSFNFDIKYNKLKTEDAEIKICEYYHSKIFDL